MALRVVGAGLSRTGTLSLKMALERLLGAPCYHMVEVFEHPGHAATWADAVTGGDVDWPAFLGGYAATVDVPAVTMWRTFADLYPDALILLSVRDPAQWVRSMENTILPRMRDTEAQLAAGLPPDATEEQRAVGRMFGGLTRTVFAGLLDDPTGGTDWYERYNAAVRASAPPGRLLEWTVADGWAPLCAALGVPVPDEPFPKANEPAEFQERVPTLSEVDVPRE